MSMQPEDTVTIEIDGQPFEARKGAMLIEVTDAAGISVPRFCYHKKLSIAANCRMCLVEVENAPKPLPACATPVADGMKVFTKSELARGAQKSVMEFLLINHPLDCPICDQGGECELQDLALGYGRDVSRFSEGKRVVRDKYIGPLIATDMTRCIHCTRCIRMLEEVAGKMELGATGRGENMEIGNYIENSLESELSGNIIDICPVGALTSRPFRFKARAWELTQHASVAPHDSIGSNIFVHIRRGEVMRVVPRENEAINEVWLSDRDRFSYEGLYSDDRVTMPMIKVDGVWRETDWDSALQATVDGVQGVISDQGADQVGVLVSPSSTLEEMTLIQAIARGLGINNIDHRLRQTDFNGQDNAPLYPSLGQSLEALETVNAALLIGSNTRKQQPMAGLRLRKAALAGAKVMLINPVDYEINFPVYESIITAPSQMISELAAIARAVLDKTGGSAPASVQSLVADASPGPQHLSICNTLLEAENATVLLGNGAVSHLQYSVINALAGVIAKASQSILGLLPEAANSVGGWLAGVLPHRGPAGEAVSNAGMNAHAMLSDPRKAYILLGVEPSHDCQDSAAANKAMEQAGFVVSISPYANDNIKACANVLLPVGPFTETSGTYINATGEWQSFSGMASPQGESRPAWKVLRVLGNRLGLDGFEYTRSEQVRDELRSKDNQDAVSNLQADGAVAEAFAIEGLERIGDVAIHSLDPLVRRAASLQATPDAELARKVRMNILQADACGVLGADTVRIIQGEHSVTMDLEVDDRVPRGCVWLHTGIDETAGLGAGFGSVEVEKTGVV